MSEAEASSKHKSERARGQHAVWSLAMCAAHRRPDIAAAASGLGWRGSRTSAQPVRYASKCTAVCSRTRVVAVTNKDSEQESSRPPCGPRATAGNDESGSEHSHVDGGARGAAKGSRRWTTVETIRMATGRNGRVCSARSVHHGAGTVARQGRSDRVSAEGPRCHPLAQHTNEWHETARQ